MPARRLLAGFLLLLACAARAGERSYDVFPRSDEVFKNLLADPRQIQLAASYYRWYGKNTADAALGHSWGMARWRTRDKAWVWQWDVEAMAYSRFRLSGAINEFETIDFFANLPIEIRHGIFSGRLMLFHESSHLGDDYIRRTADMGFRYSIDGLRATVSVEPAKCLRLYGGGTYLLHTLPSPARGALQGGFELTSNELDLLPDYPSWIYLAQDVQSHENVNWNVNSNTVLGLRVGFKGAIRSMRFYLGYFTGHSPYGQFFAQHDHYANFGIAFDF